MILLYIYFWLILLSIYKKKYNKNKIIYMLININFTLFYIYIKDLTIIRPLEKIMLIIIMMILIFLALMYI